MTTILDITRRLRVEKELNREVFFDRELHIPNHVQMERDMAAERSRECLVAVDIENLRRINNNYGRECGSALLRAVRDYILEMRIPDSVLYRGELSHFCILFNKAKTDMDFPRQTAKKIHERCKEAWEIYVNGRQQNIFASANVCVLPARGYSGAGQSKADKRAGSFEGLYGAMEHSLDIASKAGNVVLYDDNSREAFDNSLKLEFSLKNAVRDNMRGFHVVYQPIIDAGAGVWRGLEGLCRWDSPEFGHVLPAVFIPAAEACGLINTIDLWVLEQAVTRIKALGLDRIGSFLLEVNLSPFQFGISDLDQSIMELLRKYDYPPEKLGLEVTESCELNFSKAAMSAIGRLNELGVVIILDDFGTGYSTFNTLHKLPVKLLKTDRTFIAGMESDSHLRKLVSVIVSLAHCSDIKLVAEGVESDTQAQILKQQGADFFQGYFFSRPLTSGQLAKKLDNFCS